MHIRKVLLVGFSLLLLSGTASAQFQFRYDRTAVGFNLSLVVLEGGFHPTLGWGGLLDVAFDMGNVGEFHIFPNVEFWFSSDERPRNNLEVSVFEMAIHGDFRYYFPLPERIRARPFIGNGFVFAINWEDYDYNDVWRDYNQTKFSAGVDFLAGVDFPFTQRAVGFAETKAKLGRYDLVKFSFGMKFIL